MDYLNCLIIMILKYKNSEEKNIKVLFYTTGFNLD
jgi:hypothetical protein